MKRQFQSGERKKRGKYLKPWKAGTGPRDWHVWQYTSSTSPTLHRHGWLLHDSNGRPLPKTFSKRWNSSAVDFNCNRQGIGQADRRQFVPIVRKILLSFSWILGEIFIFFPIRGKNDVIKFMFDVWVKKKSWGKSESEKKDVKIRMNRWCYLSGSFDDSMNK